MLALLVNNAWEGNLKGRPFNPPAQVRVDRILAETAPTDKIWVDGIQPQYYLWTDRQPASAYLFFANVNPPYDVRERVLADIQRQQPKFIIAKPERVAQELKTPTSPPTLPSTSIWQPSMKRWTRACTGAANQAHRRGHPGDGPFSLPS